MAMNTQKAWLFRSRDAQAVDDLFERRVRGVGDCHG
jgi:hypothetical protein